METPLLKGRSLRWAAPKAGGRGAAVRLGNLAVRSTSRRWQVVSAIEGAQRLVRLTYQRNSF
jgi:hypothetical protein